MAGDVDSDYADSRQSILLVSVSSWHPAGCRSSSWTTFEQRSGEEISLQSSDERSAFSNTGDSRGVLADRSYSCGRGY